VAKTYWELLTGVDVLPNPLSIYREYVSIRDRRDLMEAKREGLFAV
jgi:hypothetical protein